MGPAQGAEVVIFFEGRNAAGKQGAIKRITERLSPRVVKVVALPTRKIAAQYYRSYSGFWVLAATSRCCASHQQKLPAARAWDPLASFPINP